ncbi:MAG: hypothetical protein EPN43_02210 [Jatrophihabitans sp.]|nr:MAG: hypothetical protein EPN43_02210 [Jatrophihabitans sp.]
MTTTTTTQPLLATKPEITELVAVIDSLTPQQQRDALNYLIGWTLAGVQHAFMYVTRPSVLQAASRFGVRVDAGMERNAHVAGAR